MATNPVTEPFRGEASPNCPGGGGARLWKFPGARQRQGPACAHREGVTGPPQNVEHFGIFIMNLCNLVNTSRQYLFYY